MKKYESFEDVMKSMKEYEEYFEMYKDYEMKGEVPWGGEKLYCIMIGGYLDVCDEYEKYIKN